MSKDKHKTLPLTRSVSLKDTVAGKLVKKRNNGGYGFGGTGNQAIQRISGITATDISDSTAINELLPEQTLIKRILTSSILSPKDLTTIELGYSVDNPAFTSQLAGPLLEIMSNHYDNVYKIKPQLKKILEDCLFDKGSQVRIVLPESSIDALIAGAGRVSTESLRMEGLSIGGGVEPTGILGSGLMYDPVAKKLKEPTGSTGVSLESLISGDYNVPVGNSDFAIKEFDLKILDNPSILKLPRIYDTVARQAALARVGRRFLSTVSVEARDPTAPDIPGKKTRQKGLTDNEISGLYQNGQVVHTPLVTVQRPDTNDRKSIGEATEFHPSSESCINVHVPGDPTNPIGFFFLLDRNGQFVNSSSNADAFKDLSRNQAMNGAQVGNMLQTNLLEANGRQYNQADMTKMELSELYAEIVEADLKHRFKTGIYGDNVEIAKATNVFKIMFARKMANQQTQLLFVPAELVTYFAFDYNEYGIGRSLTEKNKILGSIRAMLLFANTMFGLKNAIGRKEVNITLDETDPNPMQTVDLLMDNFARNSGSGAPWGNLNPADITDYLANGSIQLNVTGNPRYPNTKFEVNDKNSQKQMVDTTFDDEMRKRWSMGHGVAPEMIDASYGSDFAASIVQNNLLFAKQCLEYQEIFTPQISAHIVRHARSSQNVMDKLRDAVKQHKDLIKGELRDSIHDMEEGDQIESVINLFLDGFKVALPAPDTGSIESQLAAIDTQDKLFEAALDYYINDKIIDSALYGDSADVILKWREVTKAKLMRDWMQKNNIATELMQIITKNEDGDPALDIAEAHKGFMEAIEKNVGKFLKTAMEENARLAKIKAGEEAKLGINEQETDGLGGTDDNLGGDAGLGEDDLDGLGGDDTTAPDETQPENLDESEEDDVLNGEHDDLKDLDADPKEADGNPPKDEPDVDKNKS